MRKNPHLLIIFLVTLLLQIFGHLAVLIPIYFYDYLPPEGYMKFLDIYWTINYMPMSAIQMILPPIYFGPLTSPLLFTFNVFIQSLILYFFTKKQKTVS